MAGSHARPCSPAALQECPGQGPASSMTSRDGCSACPGQGTAFQWHSLSGAHPFNGTPWQRHSLAAARLSCSPCGCQCHLSHSWACPWACPWDYPCLCPFPCPWPCPWPSSRSPQRGWEAGAGGEGQAQRAPGCWTRGSLQLTEPCPKQSLSCLKQRSPICTATIWPLVGSASFRLTPRGVQQYEN